MKKKQSRLEMIRKIISSKEIRSQEELLNELSDEGFQLTQATLSRDLKQLKVAKTANAQGNYVYMLNEQMVKHHFNLQNSSFRFSAGFISLDFSGNMAVIHTRPGYASSLAIDIDNYNYEGILGTLAGDDTILMVLREDANREDIKYVLSEIQNI